MDPTKSFGDAILLAAARGGGTQGFPGPGLGGAMPLSFNMGLHLEGEVGIVRVIVTTSTDLEDDTGIALIAEAQNRPELGCVGGDMVSTRTMAGLAAYAGEVRVRAHQAVLGEATGPSVPGGVTAETLGVAGFLLGGFGFGVNHQDAPPTPHQDAPPPLW